MSLGLRIFKLGLRPGLRVCLRLEQGHFEVRVKK